VLRAALALGAVAGSIILTTLVLEIVFGVRSLRGRRRPGP
jgi:hypothetical protein